MASDEKPKIAKQAVLEGLVRAGEPLKAVEIARQVLAVKGVRLTGKMAGGMAEFRILRFRGGRGVFTSDVLGGLR